MKFGSADFKITLYPNGWYEHDNWRGQWTWNPKTRILTLHDKEAFGAEVDQIYTFRLHPNVLETVDPVPLYLKLEPKRN